MQENSKEVMGGQAPVNVQAFELEGLREEVMRVRGTRKLEMILDSSSPQDLVQSMPAQELLYTIKDIGLADSVELVLLATTEQITSCLDLDCWSKDQFQREKFDEWLLFLPAKELEASEKVLRALELELLVLYFQELFVVHYEEGDDARARGGPEFNGEVFRTPDGYYIVEIPFTSEDPRSIRARSALDLFQQYGYEFCHKLFESIRHSLPSELEELSYQFRKGRLEDLGFIDYYEALSLYQALPRNGAPKFPSEPHTGLTSLPRMMPLSQKGLFAKAFAVIGESSVRERLSFELFYLCNKMASADQVEYTNTQALSKVMRFVQRNLNIGLELLGESETHTQCLREHHLEWIFRKGFSAGLYLQQRAKKLQKDPLLTLTEKPTMSLLDPQSLRFIQGITKKKPVVYSGFDSVPGDNFRPFRSQVDVLAAEGILKKIAFLPRLFFSYFPFKNEHLRESLQGHVAFPVGLEDVHFSHLFFTALANFGLHQRFEVLPLTASQAQQFREMCFVFEGEAPFPIKTSFQKEVEGVLFQLLEKPDVEEVLLRHFLESMWTTLHEEAAYQPIGAHLEPRFFNLFLIADDDLTA